MGNLMAYVKPIIRTENWKRKKNTRLENCMDRSKAIMRTAN